MASIVYLAPRTNPTLVSDLARAGHYVSEALAVGETLYLRKTEDIDAIVIVADVADRQWPKSRAVLSRSG